MDLIPAQPLGPDDDDDSTIHTALTPPSTSASIHLALHPTAQPHFSPTPHPGATVLIKAVLSNQVITLRGGRIILSPPDGSASLWECVESNGWLGFRSAVSGAFLGRNWNLDLCCSAGWHRAWERFRVREKPERGGCVLLMDHWGSLRHVGVKGERLAVVESWEVDEVVWEFGEVEV